MIRDLGLESFHNVLVAAVEEILLTKRELDCFIQARTDTKFAVKNSASVYHYKATKEESAIEQLQKAHTNSFRAYLHALKSAAVVIPHPSSETGTGIGTGIGTGSGREGIADLLSILSSRKKLFSSGNHPIEKAIRRYLLSCVFYPSHLIDVVSVLSVTSQESVEADLISLKNIELEQSKKEKYLSLIAVKSRELECDGEYLRYINKRSLEPYATQVMTGEEVLHYFLNFLNSNYSK